MMSEIDKQRRIITSKVCSTFPHATTNSNLVEVVTATLEEHGCNDENTLLVPSFCRDKINRPLETEFAKHYTNKYSIGGLAGFPFGGLSSFREMMQNIPEKGSCLIMYGPHVGIDSQGNVKGLNPQGRAALGSCCESAIAAYHEIQRVRKGTGTLTVDHIDIQQSMVSKLLFPYGDRLENTPTPLVEIPHCLYDSQTDMVNSIVKGGHKELSRIIGDDSKIAILGGIQINTPVAGLDFFLPFVFEIRDSKNNKIADLLGNFEIADLLEF
mmetsp:Transcript_233/g.348  ORF Transcript_233/g.348 Transcript_233/m.348 type:complete len:269 (-) Transcript_233:35-841(-)